MSGGLDPGLGVLVAACDPEGGERLRRAVRAVRDWDSLVGTAERHGMTGVLWRWLEVAGSDDVPPAVVAALAARAGSVERRSLRMSAHLIRLLRTLGDAGVRAVPFKGSTLSQQAYGDPGLRSFGDLDLLVAADDAPTALEALRPVGYGGEHAPYHGPDDVVVLRVNQEIALVRDGGPTVDLHVETSTSLGGPSAVPAAAVIERAQPLELCGHVVLAPCEDDVVLLQCVHGARHGWERLERVACLAGPVRGVTARGGWDALIDRAATYGSVRKLLVGVLLAGLLAGGEPPPPVVAAAALDSAVWPLTQTALAAPLTRERRPRTARGEAHRRLAYEDTPAAAARLLWRRWTLPGYEDWESLRLPARAFPLYRVWRPARLAVKYGRRALRTAIGARRA